jgi:glycosyltransferase involved in cell wall biosynthesis
VFGPHAGRLHLVILVHMPLGGDAEAGALAAARAVVTTSEWTARRLTSLHGVPAGRVHVAHPGVDKAPLTHGSASGGRLLSVAALTANKGHDVLAAALAEIADQPFTCAFVGSLTRDPEFAAGIRDRIAADGLAGRVRFTGAVGGAGLAAAYCAADLLVLASYGETYGMVVTEALARGIPVLATDTGGLPEALGRAPDGTVPGLLVEPGDPGALAAALRRWLGDPALRQRLRLSARGRREGLTGWDVTAGLLAGVLQGVAA